MWTLVMKPELIEILNNFHTQLDEYELDLPIEIRELFEKLSDFLDEHDPVAPE